MGGAAPAARTADTLERSLRRRRKSGGRHGANSWCWGILNQQRLIPTTQNGSLHDAREIMLPSDVRT